LEKGSFVRTSLAALAAAIQDVEQHATPKSRGGDRSPLRTGWLDVDHALGGGMRRGAIHEWFGDGDDQSMPNPSQSILIHLAERAVRSTESGCGSQRALWIGRRCWPYPRALVRDGDRTLLNRSVFVDPSDTASRVWAIDHALRSSAVAAVIADGHGIDMAQSRRLQLAAEAGQALALIARPHKDQSELSAAFTRWRACPSLSTSNVGGAEANPRWTIELLRCKGMRPSEARPCWVLELDRAKGLVSVPADLGDRSGETRQTDEPIRRSA